MNAFTRWTLAAGLLSGGLFYMGLAREVVVRGELGDSYLRRSSELGAEAITHNDLIEPLSPYRASRVIAVPLDPGARQLVFASVDDDGRFEMRLPREGSWALMLVDHESVVARQHFQGVVAFRTLGGRRLIFKPEEHFGRVSLGELRADDGFALSELEINGDESIRGPALSKLMQDQEDFIFNVRTIYWDLMGSRLHVQADEPNPFSIAETHK